MSKLNWTTDEWWINKYPDPKETFKNKLLRIFRPKKYKKLVEKWTIALTRQVDKFIARGDMVDTENHDLESKYTGLFGGFKFGKWKETGVDYEMDVKMISEEKHHFPMDPRLIEAREDIKPTIIEAIEKKYPETKGKFNIVFNDEIKVKKKNE